MAWRTVVKILLAPFILLLQAFKIYVLGCFLVYLERAARGVGFGLCVCFKCTYKDKQFPATAASIGKWKDKTPQQIEQEVEWKRVGEIFVKSGQSGGKLFSGGIDASDICQGSVGDCWLMSALACLAEVEGAVQRVFKTREYTSYGKYRLRFFDQETKEFVTVVVDDFIPVNKSNGEPVFAKPQGDEAWVLLLEKAFAKFMGSYAALDGNLPLYALEALTGNYVFCFRLEPAKDGKPAAWRRWELLHKPGTRGDCRLLSCKDEPGCPSELNDVDMFQNVLYYNRKRSVIAAYTTDGNDTQNVDGIVQGHAYSLVNVREVDQFRLVQLRNPWGSFEWKGAWSDGSELWKQYPKVARAVDFTAADDGTFWMEWKDFCTYYKGLDFCFRTTGWEDLTIDIHEEHPICGPSLGCMQGCFEFWCCCKGCHALLCGNKKQQFEKAPEKGCCSCMHA